MQIKFYRRLQNMGKVQSKSDTLDKVKPINRVELLKPINRDTVTFSDVSLHLSIKEGLIKKLESTLQECNDILAKYSVIDDDDYKRHGHGKNTIQEILRIKESVISYLNMVKNSKDLKDIHELEKYIDNFYVTKVNLLLSSYIAEIMNHYNNTVVPPYYHFAGLEVSKWRREAMKIFPNIDLSIYNDYQLKQYVIAYKNGIAPDTLLNIMDVRRSPEHIRLLFLLPENEMMDVLAHPEYTVSHIQGMFPDLLEEIDKNKKGLV